MVVEPDSETEHQVVGVLQFVEAVTDMEEGATGEIQFQGQYLIPAVEVSLGVD